MHHTGQQVTVIQIFEQESEEGTQVNMWAESSQLSGVEAGVQTRHIGNFVGREIPVIKCDSKFQRKKPR